MPRPTLRPDFLVGSFKKKHVATEAAKNLSTSRVAWDVVSIESGFALRRRNDR